MKCPNCNKDLNVPDVAERNMESYGKDVLVRTLCCGGPVRLSPVFSYTAYTYFGNVTEDDWGNKFKNNPHEQENER